MAAPTINFAGFVYDDSGDPVSGATIHIYDKNSTTPARESTSVTTNVSGYYSYSHATAGEFDVEIVKGTSKRRYKFDDKIHLSEIDVEKLSIRGNEGAISGLYMYADEGDDVTDQWLIDVGTNGVIAFGNDAASQGVFVDQVTFAPNSTVTDGTVAVKGNLTVGNALTVTGTTTLNGNLVLGDAAADTLTVGATLQGASPLTFEGGTSDGHETTFAITDPTADRTITFPNLSGTVQLSGNPISGTTIDASTDFTIGDTVITNGVITDSTGLALTANVTLTDGSYNLNIASHDGTNGLALAGTVVTTSATELNLIDGGTARGTTAIADGDGVLINDAGTMRMTTVQTLAAYLDDEITAMPNLVTTGTIGTGTWEADDVAVAHGGTGASTLTDGGILLGSGTSAITAMAVLADGEMIVGDGSTDPVAESGATLRTSIGLGTGNNAQFTNLTLTGTLDVAGATVFNEAGADVDFRVEGDTATHLIFADASTDLVGIGGTPVANSKLHVIESDGEGTPTLIAQNVATFQRNDGSGYHAYVTVVGGTAAYSGLYLTDKDNSTGTGGIRYLNGTERLELIANNTEIARLDDTGLNVVTGSLEVATIDYTDGDLAMTIADGGGVSFAQAATFDDDITIDGDGKWLYIKGGATSTNATGIAWTFNSADTRYSEIQMDYDTRASVGFLIHSGYPITMDATTQINFDISGTTYMTLAAAGLTLVADGYIAFGDTDHLIDVNAGHMVFKMPTNEDFYWQHGSTNLMWLDTSASTLYVGLNDSVAGILHALAGASGQAEGGELRLGTAADYDASYNYYFFDAYEDDLRIGRAGNVDGYLRSSGSWEFHGDVFLYGTTPALMLGDGGAEDTKMTLNGNAQDYYMALDDSGDNWVFGRGNSVGSSVSMYFGTDGFLRHNVGVTILDGIPLYFGNAPDYKMYYDNSNTRWAMMTGDSNGSGTDADIIRIEDGQMTIDADATWDDNVSFDIYDDALLLEASKSPTAEAYDFGNGVMKRGQEALIEAGVLKRYDDGWVGYNDQRMAALLAGGIYQTRQLVDEMKEKISELENKVKKLGG